MFKKRKHYLKTSITYLYPQKNAYLPSKRRLLKRSRENLEPWKLWTRCVTFSLCPKNPEEVFLWMGWEVEKMRKTAHQDFTTFSWLTPLACHVHGRGRGGRQAYPRADYLDTVGQNVGGWHHRSADCLGAVCVFVWQAKNSWRAGQG